MKLTYWHAENHDDHKCYDIRAQTKKEALAQKAAGEANGSDFGPVEKVEIEYASGFDLLVQALSEANFGY